MEARKAASVILIIVSAGCGSSKIEGTKVCRRYPTAFTENGRAYTCTFDGGHVLRCDDSARLVVQEWLYATATDFVMEPQVPNRILVQSRSFVTLGMVNTSSSTSTDYTYDASGRVVERRKRRSDFTGARELETVTYTAWDARGRPTAGTVRTPDATGAITIRYDDTARRMEASNGESVTQDANGNVVREVFVLGFGAPGTADFVIQGTAESCL
jgi:hypothetical protein